MSNIQVKRKNFVNVSSGTITTGGSADFGAFNAGGFARFTGLVSTQASLSIRIRSGISSGSYIVSSAFAVSSGVFPFEVVNFGLSAYFDITAAQSTAYQLIINGEPMR
jgi:hypothetical protein